MRRDRVTVVQIVLSGLLSVLLAVAVNVATGGDLPDPVRPFAWLAWPAVGLLAVTVTALAIWQHQRTPVRRGAAPAELPAPRPMSGRAAEIRTVMAAARARTGIFLITGVPGTGKTVLALRAAHDLRDRFPDGQLYVDLRGSDPDPVRPEVALVRFLRALGEPDTDGGLDELAARFRTAVTGRRLLVVLDDAGTDDQVTPLVPGDGGGFVLVTSRRQLSAQGSPAVRLGELTVADGRAMLSRAVGGGRVAADPDGADRIVAACAGLPLAVQLAGARLRARPEWSLSALADRLDDEQLRLSELRRGDTAVRGTFRSAYDSLSPGQRLVFRRIGAHPGKVFGLGAAAALTGLAERDVAEVLDRLADAMLIENPAPDRFRLHDLLRLYARELFTDEEPATDRDECVDRLLDWTIAIPAEATARWRADELDNALAALALAVHTGRHAVAWELAEAVHGQLTAGGDHVHRLPLWRMAATAAAGLGDDLKRARAMRWIAHSHRIDGDLESSRAAAQEAVALAEGDPWETAQSSRSLGETLRGLRCFEQSRDALLRALDGFAALGHPEEELEVRSALAGLYNDFHRPGEAIAMLESAVPLLPAQEAPIHAWVHLGFAVAYRQDGRDAEASAECDVVTAIGKRLGDGFILGYCHQERGWIAAGKGDYVEAERHFRQMRDLLDGVRTGTGVGIADDALGMIAQARGRRREAQRRFDAAITRFERLGDTVRAGQSRERRAATEHGSRHAPSR